MPPRYSLVAADHLALKSLIENLLPRAGTYLDLRDVARRVADVTQEAPGNRMGVESSAMPGALRAVLPCAR